VKRRRRDRLSAARWPASACFERRDSKVVDEARSNFGAIMRTEPEEEGILILVKVEEGSI
jgi:hypothetical protein